MNIKEFFATLGIQLDDESFRQADAALQVVEDGLKVLAAGAVVATTALAGLVLHTANEASEITKLATLMGVSTDVAQEWAYAAQQSGLSADDFGQMVAELAENLGEAAGGSGEAADAFKSLGVSMKDNQGKLKETPVALAEIADKLAVMANGQKKTAIITGLFGEEGIKLLPVLNQGSAGLAKYAEEARALGLVLDQDAIKTANELKINLNTLQSTVSSLGASLAGPLVAEVNEALKSLKEWWKINGALTKQRMEKVLGVVLAIIRPLWRMVVLLGKAVGFVVDNWQTFLVVVGSLLVAFYVSQLKWHTLLLASWVRLGLAAVLAGIKTAAAWALAAAPIIALAALIALVVLLIQDAWVWAKGGESVLGDLLGTWDEFWAKFLKENPDDPWWLKAIKTALRTAKELIELLRQLSPESAKAAITGKAAEIGTGISTFGENLRRKERWRTGTQTEQDIKDAQEAAAQREAMSSWLGGGLSGLMNFQSNASVKPAMLAAPVTNAKNVTTTNNITLNANGVQSPEKFVEDAWGKLQEYLADENSAASKGGN